MSSELVVTVAQMTSIDDVTSNLNQMENLLEKAFSDGHSDLVCFPENCLYFRIVEGQKIPGFSLSHPVFEKLSELARTYSTHLHLGSVPLYVDEQLYNSSVLITPEGKVTSTYQKLHLFDIQLDGQKPIRESDVFCHGQKINIIEINGWRIGEAICYDLRFAELFALYARHEVDVLLLPAAFLVKTGEAHWEVLLRARAIENQAYLLASAQGGEHLGVAGGKRETYGHSLIIDPWGTVVDQINQSNPEVIVARLSREKIAATRKQIPMKSHRRLPLA